MKQVTSKAPANGDTVRNARFRNWVARRCSPRSTMTLIMFATTATGSIASFILLHAGVANFGIRYSLAVLAAYGTLVALISVWGRYEARRLEQGNALSGDGGTVSNLFDAGGGDLWPGAGGGSGTSASARVSGGGSSGGAGASASYDNASTPAIESSASPGRSNGGSSGGGGFSLDLDGDEIVVLLLIIAAVAMAFLAAAYIVWIAPKFLGDVLASTVASAGMSHQITRHEPGWLGVVVKRTIWPALAVFVMFTTAGFALQSYAPGARTLHGAWEYHLARHAVQ